MTNNQNFRFSGNRNFRGIKFSGKSKFFGSQNFRESNFWNRIFHEIEIFGESKFPSMELFGHLRGIETDFSYLSSIFLGLIGISIMINLPSAIKLIFYLIQCAISYSLLYLGHGVDIFDNLDIILYIVRVSRDPFDGDSYTTSTDDYSIMPSLWSSIPAITVWVVALFLVSIRHSVYWAASSLSPNRCHW